MGAGITLAGQPQRFQCMTTRTTHHRCSSMPSLSMRSRQKVIRRLRNANNNNNNKPEVGNLASIIKSFPELGEKSSINLLNKAIFLFSCFIWIILIQIWFLQWGSSKTPQSSKWFWILHNIWLTVITGLCPVPSVVNRISNAFIRTWSNTFSRWPHLQCTRPRFSKNVKQHLLHLQTHPHPYPLRWQALSLARHPAPAGHPTTGKPFTDPRPAKEYWLIQNNAVRRPI